MIHTSNAVSANWFRMFKTVAPAFAIEPITAPVQDQADIQRTIESLAREPEGGLILPSDTFVENPSVRKFIVGLTALHHCLRCTLIQSSFVMVGLCPTELISSTNIEAPHPT
jgi:hypothetical protein